MIFYKLCRKNHKNIFDESENTPKQCSVCGMKLDEQVRILKDSEMNELSISEKNLKCREAENEMKPRFSFKIDKFKCLLQIPDEREQLILGREGLGSEDELWGFNISRQHLLLKPMQGGVFITDLGSTNGTVFKGERLGKGEQRLVLPGEKVILDANLNDVEMILVKN